MKAIYLVFTHSGTTLSKAIKLFTKDEYTHISISFERDIKELYSFGRVYPNNPFIGGFAIERISEYPSFYMQSPFVVYELIINEIQYNSIRKNIDTILKHKNNFRYNFIGLISASLGLELNRENAFFCSQFICHMFRSININISDNPTGITSPMDIKIKLEKMGYIPIKKGKLYEILE